MYVTENSIIKTEFECDSDGNLIVEGRDMAIGTQSNLDKDGVSSIDSPLVMDIMQRR
jgi:hypothetical protein